MNNNISITKKVVNLYIYISYTLSPWLRDLNTDFILKELRMWICKAN